MKKDEKAVNVPVLYGVSEAAKIIGCSTRTIQRYVADGTLKTFIVAGRRRITKENLERYLNGEDQQ